ncbi:YkgJ family cysteine cluster protein [Helicobacter suis]|uniref:YkgJ family cysteine cluster protein n=1 Tax=Helicobacter suis TaxID=104628 RepID=UPI0013D7FF04|nr:YkgJ family cysteine cluster protein [Helicobacter suis]
MRSFSFNPNACTTCGARCCLGKRGYVFVSVEQMRAISAFLNLSFETFTLKYIRKVQNAYSLLEKPAHDAKNGWACVFLEEETKRCRIYPVRPKQCATFPFWECFKTKQQLEKLAALCPGVVLNGL